MPVRPAPAPRPDAAAAAQPSGAADAPADVVAVLVAHDGARWLPEALAALAAQTVRPRRVVAVDTGSADGSGDLLRAALGADAVLELPRSTGYPDAVRAGVAHADRLDGGEGIPAAWLWLLHDDAAPAPDCLQALLAEGERQPSAGLLGPKALDWDDPRLLVEIGVTTDRAGTRSTGLERREPDQGQHDVLREVLAVGTAGLLARRSVWDAVGGLDPDLPLFRDELDLGWRVTSTGARVVLVPAARLRHARAATTGRRAPGVLRGPAARLDRRHAMFVLLAHASGRRFLPALLALVLGSVLRALGLLLLRRLRDARDELGALGAVLAAPRRLVRARRVRRRLRALPAGAVRPLLASRVGRLRSRVDVTSAWLGGGTADRPVTMGFADGEPGTEPTAGAAGLLRAALRRPPVLLVLGLALVALLAERAVLAPSGGLLSGGRLLPPPDGAGDLWAAYGASWSSVGLGTPAAPPPSLAVLGGLSTLLLGKPWLAVDLLLLSGVPLAGLTAYLAARRVVPSRAVRLWAAATWALLPVATGAVAAGRLDAAAVQVALPLLALAAEGVLRHDPRGRWHRVWGTGLLLTAVAALAPTLWLVAAPLLLLAGVAGIARATGPSRSAAWRRAAAAALVTALPVVLLLPWSLEAARVPRLLLHGPGRLAPDPALADPALPTWHLLLLSPGGAGVPAVWLTAGVLAAALAGLVRRDRRDTAVAAWVVALGGLLVALVLSRTAVASAAGGPALPVWPGVPLQVAAGGLLLAAVVAADGVRGRLSRLDFGWRQVTAAAVAAAAAAAPVLAAGAWVARGAHDPLDRRADAVLPAFVAAELRAEPGVRALALRIEPDGSVGYALRGGRGIRLGDADLPPPAGRADTVDAVSGVVADLVSQRGSTAAEALSTLAVRYVVLPREAAGSAVAAALDAQGGLARRSEDPVLLWQVRAPTAALTVLPPATARAAVEGPALSVPAGLDADPPQPLTGGLRDAVLPAGDPGRLLVLAEARDPGWQATLDGRRLDPATAWGWAQAFVLPTQGGAVQVRHGGGERTAALALQAAGVLLVAVLAAPGGRRRTGLEPVGQAAGEGQP